MESDIFTLQAEIIVLKKQLLHLQQELIEAERIIRILNSKLRGRKKTLPREQLTLDFD